MGPETDLTSSLTFSSAEIFVLFDAISINLAK